MYTNTGCSKRGLCEVILPLASFTETWTLSPASWFAIPRVPPTPDPLQLHPCSALTSAPVLVLGAPASLTASARAGPSAWSTLAWLTPT